jgi:hypothetical protein
MCENRFDPRHRGAYTDTSEDTRGDVMTRTSGILAKLVLAAAATTVDAENVWTSLGPPDLGVITHIALVDSTAYAGTWNGVFRSDDGGVHWRSSGLA